MASDLLTFLKSLPDGWEPEELLPILRNENSEPLTQDMQHIIADVIEALVDRVDDLQYELTLRK